MQRRRPNLLLSGGTALGLIVIAQPGCMPDFNALSEKWQPESGASGKPQHGGSSGSSGEAPVAGMSNGGMSTGGTSNGGMSTGGGGHGQGGKGGGHPSAGVGGSTGSGAVAGMENAGNGGENEAGSGGTGGTTESGGTGGTSGTSGNGGEGGLQCDPALTICPGSDACTDLTVGNPSGATVTDCGACGVTCSLTNAATATCSASVCHPVCQGTFANCNGSTANDGCEADLSSTATCGSCGRACSAYGAPTTRACTDGKCVPTCGAKYADCVLDDGTTADNGCETYLDGLTTCGTGCTGGVACDPDQVCNNGACVTADGLAVMSIPFTAAGQGQRYADKFTLVNLSGATLTLRVYAPGATNGYMNVLFVDASFAQGAAVTTPFTTLSAGWTDVSIPAQSGSYDPTSIYQISIEFYTSGTGPWLNPTVIYLDGVRSSNLAVNDTFDTSKGNMVTSSLLFVSGSSLGWTASIPPP
jgi:hypothetical protein